MGPLQTLFSMLDGSSEFKGIGCYLGEEHIYQNHATPRVVMVPRGGPYTPTMQPGYSKATPTTSTLADRIPLRGVKEAVEFHLYAKSTSAGATDADHFSAVESLRNSLIWALNAQKPAGLYYVLESQQWVYSSGQNKFGRALIVRCTFDITIPDETGHTATISNRTITVSNS